MNPYDMNNGYNYHTGMQNRLYPNGVNPRGFRKPGKQEIINWFKNYMGANELDLVDESFDNVARHVCFGGNNIELLPKKEYRLCFGEEVVVLEYYQCIKCGKIILNRNFM